MKPKTDMVTRLVKSRVTRGTMPQSLGELLEQRGTIEDAAWDLSKFTPCDYEDALAALKEVYGG